MTYEEHAAKVRVKLRKVSDKQVANMAELQRVNRAIVALERERKRLLRLGKNYAAQWDALMTELYSDPQTGQPSDT